MPYPPDMSDDELDAAARHAGASTSWGAGSYLEEINRRAVDRQTRQSISLAEDVRRLTDQIRWLTVAAVLAAIAGGAAAIIALVKS